MRKIEAIIRKSKFKHVKKALLEEGFKNFDYHLTRSSAQSENRFYRGTYYSAQAEERIKVSILILDKDLQSVLGIIKNSGATGEAMEAFIGVYKPEKMYRLIDDNGTDKLIEII